MKASRLMAVLLVTGLLLTTTLGCSGGGEDSSGNGSDGKTTSEPIKVGTLFPRSGNIAMLGEQAWRGAEIARQIVNEAGGVNGREVVFVDADAPNSQAAATETERLISQQGVRVIIGSLTSGNALAASAVTERNGVVLWETSGISDEITAKGYKYLFRTCDRGSDRGRQAMRVIAELIAPKLGVPVNELRVAIVNEDSSYGEAQMGGAKEEAEKLGINIVAHESYSSSATDLSAMVLRLKEAKPDVIFAVGYINDATLFWDQAKQYGLQVKALVGGGAGYTDPQFGKVEGERANGVLAIDMPTNIGLDKYRLEENRQVAEKFRSMYLKQFGGDKAPLSAEVGFMGAYVLLHDVLPKAGSDDPDKIVEAAKSIHIEETVMGWPVVFDETGQNVEAKPVAYQWKDQKTYLVWPSKWADKEVEDIPLPQ